MNKNNTRISVPIIALLLSFIALLSQAANVLKAMRQWLFGGATKIKVLPFYYLLLIGSVSIAQADLKEDGEIIFNWAEHDYAQFFPQPDTTKIYDYWRYRYYPTTDTYVGLDTRNGGIYVLGGLFGQTPAFVDNTPKLLTEAIKSSDIGQVSQGLTADSSATWASKTIGVCWESPATQYSLEKTWVKTAIANTCEKAGAVRFIGWDVCVPLPAFNNFIKIHINDERPHTIGLGTQLAGKPSGMVLNFDFVYWTGAGYRLPLELFPGFNAMELCQDGGNVPRGFSDPLRIPSNSEREFCIKAIAVHEFGHALGFSHEIIRQDGSRCEENDIKDQSGNWKVTPYDLFSIMNYCN